MTGLPSFSFINGITMQVSLKYHCFSSRAIFSEFRIAAAHTICNNLVYNRLAFCSLLCGYNVNLPTGGMYCYK